MGQGQPRLIIWTALVVLPYTMLHPRFQGHWSIGSGEDFLRFLPYMSMAAMLVMWPRPFEQLFFLKGPGGCIWNLGQPRIIIWYKSLCNQIWPWLKIGQGQPRVIIWTTLVVLPYRMLHTRFQGHWSIGSGEDFLRFLPYMSMAAMLVMWPRPFEQLFFP